MLRLKKMNVPALLVWLLLTVLSPVAKVLAITAAFLAVVFDGIAQASAHGRTYTRTTTTRPAPAGPVSLPLAKGR